MEKELLKIKCPNCSAVLTIKSMPSLESKSINCPVCKKTNRFTTYQKVNTDQPNQNSGSSDTSNNQNPIGQLQVLNTSLIYQLKEGMNVVGRKAKTSTADIQIDTTDRTMSRAHMTIDVCRFTDNYLHYFSNYNTPNPTFINGVLMEEGDKMILKGGEIIKMGDVLIKFILSLDNETVY